MKIVVDRGRCIAASNCIGLAPRVFRLDGSRKAVVIGTEGTDEATIIEAAEACPTQAIQLFEDGTGEKLFP